MKRISGTRVKSLAQDTLGWFEGTVAQWPGDLVSLGQRNSWWVCNSPAPRWLFASQWPPAQRHMSQPREPCELGRHLGRSWLLTSGSDKPPSSGLGAAIVAALGPKLIKWGRMGRCGQLRPGESLAPDEGSFSPLFPRSAYRTTEVAHRGFVSSLAVSDYNSSVQESLHRCGWAACPCSGE